MDPFIRPILNVPFIDALAVTPNDGVDLPPPTGPARPTQAIVAGVSGNISVITAMGTTLTIPIIAGYWLPLQVTRVRATGTSATGIVAFY